MNWTQASVVVDRFIRLVDGDLNELKHKHVLIKQYERENDFERMAVEKNQSDRLINQIQTAFQKVMGIRQELSDTHRCQFDARIEPVRMRIQAVLSAISSLRSNEDETPFKPTGKPSKNPFEDEDNLFNDCFEDEASSSFNQSDYEMQLQQEQKISRKKAEALKLQMEQTKANAEATKKLEQDIEDLNQVMEDLATLVHSQNEIVDSIEEQVERSAHEVQQGNRQLKQAVRSNQAKVPIIGMAVGAVALGGPVGIGAGSIILGGISALGGAVAGLMGGRAIRQKNIEESSK